MHLPLDTDDRNTSLYLNLYDCIHILEYENYMIIYGKYKGGLNRGVASWSLTSPAYREIQENAPSRKFGAGNTI